MSEPFVGEIKFMANDFAPRGWAYCDGQLLAISQNQALFSLLGTIYGGDGRTDFALPDLRGRTPIHAGTGPRLPTYRLGQKGGTETEIITVSQLPSHSHTVRADTGTTKISPVGHNIGQLTFDKSADGHMAPTTATGGGQPHENMQPFLTIGLCIALVGIYPSHS